MVKISSGACFWWIKTDAKFFGGETPPMKILSLGYRLYRTFALQISLILATRTAVVNGAGRKLIPIPWYPRIYPFLIYINTCCSFLWETENSVMLMDTMVTENLPSTSKLVWLCMEAVVYIYISSNEFQGKAILQQLTYLSRFLENI